jgi:hypothetical protein
MKYTVLLLVVVSVVGCASAPGQLPPLTPTSEADVVLVWVGQGEAERIEEGVWVRHPELDYDFSVEQRRLGSSWESVKSLRRRSAAYDTRVAGDRVQTYFFKLTYAAPNAQGRIVSTATTSLGQGTGTVDREFRQAELNLSADVSSLAPFDRYRITQTYDYEGGTLKELVELNKGTTPWVRNHETAALFARHSFGMAPTVR